MRKRHVRGVFLRKRFLELTGCQKQSIVTLPQCCLETFKLSELPQKFKDSVFFYDNFFEDLKLCLKSYQRDDYVKVNTQNAILPSFVYGQKGDYIFKQKPAYKFDINSAFISCFLNKEFVIPRSYKVYVNLVNNDADKYFQTLTSEFLKSKTGYVKAKIVINRTFEHIPFMPYRNQNKVIYTFCKICQDLTRNCSHSNVERGFNCTALLEDFIFMKDVLKYNIQCLHLIIFDAHHNESLANFCKKLIEMRSEFSYFIKQISLRGLGRSSLKIENDSNRSEILTSDLELYMKLNSDVGDIKFLDFQGDLCIMNKTVRQPNFVIKQKCLALNISNILFASSSNCVRREMFKIYFFTLNSLLNESKIIRFDCDSFVFYSANASDYKKLQKFLMSTKFTFKVEYDDIIQITNFSRQSHVIITKDKKIIKCPGLSLSLLKRYCIYKNYLHGETS